MQSLHSPEVELRLAAIRVRNTRIIAWLVFASKSLSILSAVLAKGVPPYIREAFLWMRIPDLILNLIIVFAIQITSPVPAILRLFFLYNVTLIVIVESVFTQPLSGWAFSWVNFTAAMGSIIAFDPIREKRYGHIAIIGNYILTVLGIFLHPKLSYIPPNPISQGLARFILITVVVGIAGLLVFNHYGRLMSDAVRFATQFREASEAQKALADEALRQKALAEQRQAEVEAVLAEVARLRDLELQRAEKQRFIAEYETLMRESYGIGLSDFGQKLLDTLARDLPVLGSIFYIRRGQDWQVMATAGFPSEEGRILRSGLLDMVAGLRTAHLLSPPPAGTKRPQGVLHSPAPKAILYLPFFSEATAETICIAELLLYETPAEDKINATNELLQRVGTYLWIRLEREAIQVL